MSDDSLTDEVTRDEILRDGLIIEQPKKGYRFTVDPLLLVDFVLRGRDRTLGAVADFGTGAGVVALALANKDQEARVTALELQPRLYALAKKNVEENGYAERITVHSVDICDADRMKREVPGGSFDWVLSNPPYRPLGEGDANPAMESAIARHEVKMTLDVWCAEIRRVLKPAGRAAIIYPAERLSRALAIFEAEQLRPLRVRFVHPRPGEPATRVLIEAQKGAKGNLVVESPWLILDEKGERTRETNLALGETVP